MLTDHLPVYGLRLRTERLELRLPDLDELAALADVAAEGVHEPGLMPFAFPWSDATPAERGRSVALWYHRAIGRWETDGWGIPFVVFFGREPVGVQVVRGERFAITREIDTGSWLGLAYQGKGIGTEMRAAVLHLAFAGLGAEWATSGSFDGNESSAGVSRRLGYRPDGIRHCVVQNKLRRTHCWRLGREDWEAARRHEVAIEGLGQSMLAMLGLSETGVIKAP